MTTHNPAIDVTCPECGSWPGKRCRDFEWPNSKNPMSEPHIARVKAAVAVDVVLAEVDQ